MWLSWDEVNFYAEFFEFPTVPVDAADVQPNRLGEKLFELRIKEYGTAPSALGAEREGLVVRVQREFRDEEFKDGVLKWVRQNHVQTDEHWRRNWKQAQLKHE